VPQAQFLSNFSRFAETRAADETSKKARELQLSGFIGVHQQFRICSSALTLLNSDLLTKHSCFVKRIFSGSDFRPALPIPPDEDRYPKSEA
jgi:hypothetical protein